MSEQTRGYRLNRRFARPVLRVDLYRGLMGEQAGWQHHLERLAEGRRVADAAHAPFLHLQVVWVLALFLGLIAAAQLAARGRRAHQAVGLLGVPLSGEPVWARTCNIFVKGGGTDEDWL